MVRTFDCFSKDLNEFCHFLSGRSRQSRRALLLTLESLAATKQGVAQPAEFAHHSEFPSKFLLRRQTHTCGLTSMSCSCMSTNAKNCRFLAERNCRASAKLTCSKKNFSMWSHNGTIVHVKNGVKEGSTLLLSCNCHDERHTDWRPSIIFGKT